MMHACIQDYVLSNLLEVEHGNVGFDLPGRKLGVYCSVCSDRCLWVILTYSAIHTPSLWEGDGAVAVAVAAGFGV